MSAARLRGGVLATVLYLLCAGWVVGYLRLLVEPAPSSRELIAAVLIIGAVAWGLRAIRPRTGRIIATVLAALIGVLLVLGERSGAWPWREDVSGRNGYLGAGGYLDRIADTLHNAGAAWVRIVFPADGVGEPDAVVGVRLIVLGLLIACASGLIAFRVPLLGVLAAATAATIGTLFITREHIVLQGLALCLLGVVVLGATAAEQQRGRGRLTAVAAGGLVLVAVVLAAAPGVAPTGALEWRRWAFDQPEPVNVGFVWEQQLTRLDFGKDVVPVLEVDDPTVGYLRVGVLERFDGYRWQAAQRPIATSRSATINVPDRLLAPELQKDGGKLRRAEVRNLAVLTQDLPLPSGTVAISGLSSAVRPVTLASGGSVVLASELPVGATYTVEFADRSLTPAALDADVLGGPADPHEAALQELAGQVSTGRHVDPEGPGPWNTDFSTGANQPIAPAQSNPSPSAPKVLSKPDPADLAVDGSTYPPFGQAGREREVPRVLRTQIKGSIFASSTVYGWTEGYRMARAVTRKATTPYQAAVLLEHWFQTAFTYDETASYGENTVMGPLPTFLLSDQRTGHCQYFAGSMAVLLRMLGIPARVAFGFAQGQLEGGKRIVSNRDAHAWVEVRFPYAGWVSFEPTPSRRLATSSSSTSSGFNTSDIVQPGGSLAGIGGEENLPSAVGPNRGTSQASAAALAPTEDGPSPWPRRLLLLLAAGIAVVGLGVLIWLAKRLRTWRSRRTDDPRRGASAAHAELAEWLEDQGIPTRGESSDEVGAQAATAFAVSTERWVDAVTLARFGPPTAAAAALPVARAETRRLTRELRGRCSRRERARGAVRPRHLRP